MSVVCYAGLRIDFWNIMEKSLEVFANSWFPLKTPTSVSRPSTICCHVCRGSPQKSSCWGCVYMTQMQSPAIFFKVLTKARLGQERRLCAETRAGAPPLQANCGKDRTDKTAGGVLPLNNLSTTCKAVPLLVPGLQEWLKCFVQGINTSYEWQGTCVTGKLGTSPIFK